MSAADEPVRFDPSDFGAIPSSRALRSWMRRTRRQHADRSFWEIFEDAYLVLFTLAMVGATGGNVVRHLNSNAATCTSWTCGQLTSWLPWIVIPLLLATTIRVLLAVGPVSASRATGFWLLATPVNRASLLRPAYRLVIASVTVIGVVTGAVIWALLGEPWFDVIEAAVLIGAVLVCAAAATVWAQQTTRRSKWALRVSDVLLLAAVIPAVILAFRPGEDRFGNQVLGSTFIGLDARHELVDTYGYPTLQFGEVRDAGGLTSGQLYLLVLCAAAVVVGAVLTFVASRTLDRLGRVSVIAGGELLAGLAGAASSLDISMLGDVIAGRHWRLKGRVRSRRGRGADGAAIVHREFRRILRWPRRIAVAFGLLVVPYAVHGAGFHVLVPIAAAIAGFIAVRPMLDGLRTACRSTGLVRALGWDLRELRVVMAVVPGLFTIVWAACAFPAIGSAASSFAVAAAVISGTVRHASARPPSYAGPLVTSPMGAIPPGLFSQPARGFDLLVLCLAPVLFNLSSLWVVVIPSVVLMLMFAVRPKTA
ncbi:DUF6297 family protein [Kribbella sp. VKM Ac-2566]|uniref:DUF6297 family protein n=1 Tax=Kribbella sp. VKM Ac-2566 TaxID=2512218 RepID=UPI001062E520|nr:DUF6297 family protein [Kribbella sp. VKM Ac-2566]TDX02926.1 hypothetical protein EV647_1147 [Kribbella sp. VKM Ac-2566]